MASSPTPPPAHAAPRRVVDGMLSETLGRKVWCLVDGSVPVADLVIILAERGREVAILRTSGASAPAPAPRVSSIAQACSHFAVASADVVLVCGDQAVDLERFDSAGARIVIVGNPSPSARGMLSVRDPIALAGLFDRVTTFRTTSTYHEV